MQTREALLERIPKGGICAEIGVLNGDFSERIIQICKPSILWLVDVFEGNYYETNLVTSYEQLQLKYKNYYNGTEIQFFKGESNTFFAQQWVKDYFDFIYIDADHSYQAVKQDLKNSLNAIKCNGYIGGHDYTSLEIYNFGVIQAVHELSADYNLGFEITKEDDLPSFLFHITK